MKLLLNVNLYLKVFSLYTLSAWVKHQVGVKRPFPKVKNSALCAEFTVGPKFYFSQWKTYFTGFVAKFLKFLVISHLL